MRRRSSESRGSTTWTNNPSTYELMNLSMHACVIGDMVIVDIA